MSKIRDNLELVFTLLCGLFVTIGLIVQFFNVSHHDTRTFFYILAVVIGGFFPAKEGFEELVFERHLSVDILMVLAAIGACLIGDWFEGAVLILIFATAETLESRAMAKNQKAISQLLSLTPTTARVYRNNELVAIETKHLTIGDRIQVRKGEIVPIDGQLQTAFAQINEAAITGESLPVEKRQYDSLIGGTLNVSDTFDMTVTTDNDNTLFAKIIKMVETAQSTPSKTASFIESIEDIYVKTILICVPLFIAVMHFGLQLPFNDAFYRGMVLLTVASPCALVASATPATLSAISRASKNHILFKGGVTLDKASQIDTIVFDKTGTLTSGVIQVIDALYVEETLQHTINQIVKSAEINSSHPIAQALVTHFEHVDTIPLTTITDHTGLGLTVTLHDDHWKIGKADFVLQTAALPSPLQQPVETFLTNGASVIFVSRNDVLVAFFALQDSVKKEALHTINQLESLRVSSVMLTGDQEKTASYIAKSLAIKTVIADCLPQDKVDAILQLQQKQHVVAMVGDGINDAPALAVANVSFAMGSGSDIAMESADIILMKNDLTQIPFALQLSKALHRIVLQNVIFSIAVIVLLILSNIFQWINLPFGVVAHEGSTILVILNGLRLLNFKVKS